MIVLDTRAKKQNTHHSMMQHKKREIIFVRIEQNLFDRPVILRRWRWMYLSLEGVLTG